MKKGARFLSWQGEGKKIKSFPAKKKRKIETQSLPEKRRCPEKKKGKRIWDGRLLPGKRKGGSLTATSTLGKRVAPPLSRALQDEKRFMIAGNCARKKGPASSLTRERKAEKKREVAP